MSLNGLGEDVPISITLDEEKKLFLKLAPDDNDLPWEKMCGSLTKAAIYEAGDLVKLDLDEEILYVLPRKRVHLGLNIIGME